MILLPLIMTFLLAEPSAATAGDWFKDYAWVLILLFVTNGLQFLASRRKTNSDVNKLDAETIKTLIGTIREVQKSNDELYQQFEPMRVQARLLEDKLEEAEDKLKKCVERHADCGECHDTLVHAIDSLIELQDVLKQVEGAQVLILDIRNLVAHLRRVTRKTQQIHTTESEEGATTE